MPRPRRRTNSRMERFCHRRWPIARPEASRLAPPQAAPAVSILDMTPCPAPDTTPCPEPRLMLAKEAWAAFTARTTAS